MREGWFEPRRDTWRWRLGCWVLDNFGAFLIAETMRRRGWRRENEHTFQPPPDADFATFEAYWGPKLKSPWSGGGKIADRVFGPEKPNG